jgi:hypothetical protein
MICECYRAEKNFFGKVGVCWGTAERDACSCGGDKSKCDFYPNVREEEKKPITNADRIRAMSDEELADWVWGAETDGRAYGPRGKKSWLDWLRQEAGNERPTD